MKYIKLTKDKKALVDNEDFEKLNKYKWQYSHMGYAMHNYWDGKKIKCIMMHRMIMNPPKELFIDHINNNGLDNRRKNLRFCSPSQNQLNKKKISSRKKFKGVHFFHNKKSIYATITLNKIKYYLGTFKTELEAARAYDKKAKDLHGEFASLNFKQK